MTLFVFFVPPVGSSFMAAKEAALKATSASNKPSKPSDRGRLTVVFSLVNSPIKPVDVRFDCFLITNSGRFDHFKFYRFECLSEEYMESI